MWIAQVVARATLPIAGGERKAILLGKDEGGHGYKLLIIRGHLLVGQFFAFFPDAFARFLDHANANLVFQNGVLMLAFPEGAEVEITDSPSQDELLAAWARIGGKVEERGYG
jgi:hypothetical protein